MPVNDDPNEAERPESPSCEGAGHREAELEALWKRSSKLPPINPRPDDEILGYDDLGTFG